jgi:hypothetical protein
MFAFVDLFKGIMRPTLTLYVTVAWSFIAVASYRVNPAAFGDNAKFVVITILNLGVTAFTWWFADRRMAKNITKMYEGK